ncbi:MAG TPA: hypothetical protein VFO35_01965, partial [Steroidobacteraceae bacterium]|nr:hypothetical protein [Steroidobacteraceae bacterium]
DRMTTGIAAADVEAVRGAKAAHGAMAVHAPPDHRGPIGLQLQAAALHRQLRAPRAAIRRKSGAAVVAADALAKARRPLRKARKS